MYIISKFHDFYDSAMGLGIDKTVPYPRITRQLAQPNKVSERSLYELFQKLPPFRNRPQNGWEIKGYVLLVCGEAIPLVQIQYLSDKPNNFYSAEKAIDFIKAKGVPMARYWSWWRRHYVDSFDGIEHFFKEKEFRNLTQLHHVHKCPVILCHEEYKKVAITLNPILKELGYQTQKDPYTLFHTIYMFISGVIGTPAKEPRPISDELKAANHGHDGEYSFKTPPGQGKGNRPK